MPVYTFENKKTGKQFTEMMSIAEMEDYLKRRKSIRQVITKMNIVGGVSGISYKNDQGWKEVQSKIAEAHPQSAFAQEHRKKSIKEVKTEQAITKHKARQRDKTK
jgi:hypothetical protein|tara:strand:+ start:281 stop:595 length:315 start_codon:yes stop_codon:yes gene_type:complete